VEALMDADRLAAKLKEHGYALVGGGLFADERGVGFLIDVKQRTLRGWRAKKKGPPAVLMGRWLYDLVDLATWIRAQTQTFGQEAAALGSKRQQAASSDIDAAPRTESNRATI
jgi:hypothetical protein